MTFKYVTGRPVLDFVATVSARGTVDGEQLQRPADLAEWIAGSGLIDDVIPVGQEELDRARRVREDLFVSVSALLDGRATPPAVRSRINAVAALAPPTVHLDEEGIHRSGGLDAVLSVLARDAIDLHAGPDRQRLRWCDDATCTRPFVDRSRGGVRRWCGMKGCGDRAKAAAYRARRRGRASTA